MKRRWLIRSFFIGLLILCVGTWVESYWMWRGVMMPPCVRLNEVSGSLYFWADSQTPPQSWDWFSFTPEPLVTAKLLDAYQMSDYHMGGFACNYRSWSNRYALMVIIPLWLPTLLSALCVWSVWRTTRAKPQPRAFPIEPVPVT